jgi:hypothetical protein
MGGKSFPDAGCVIDMMKAVRRSAWQVRVARAAACAAVLICVAFACGRAARAAADCRVLDPELTGAYAGFCKHGLADGEGYAKGAAAEYRGEFHAGMKQGAGWKHWFQTGDTYSGEFLHDRKEGHGVYVWGPRSPYAGEKYDGEYHDDKRNGYGIYEWPNGDRYAGPWQDDRMTGPPTPMQINRGRYWRALAQAVKKKNVTVCWNGNGTPQPDLAKGVVESVSGDALTIRLSGKPALPGLRGAGGKAVRSDYRNWYPCY